jgi:hypothetical protein
MPRVRRPAVYAAVMQDVTPIPVGAAAFCVA